MSVFKHLCYQKENGETGSCDVYDDPNECPEPRLYCHVDGKECYVKLGEFNDPLASPLRCHVNSANRDFAILKQALTTCNLTVKKSYIYYGFNKNAAAGSMSPDTINGVTFTRISVNSRGSFVIQTTNGAYRTVHMRINGTEYGFVLDYNGDNQTEGRQDIYHYFFNNINNTIQIQILVR